MYEVSLGWLVVIMLLQILFCWVKLNYALLGYHRQQAYMYIFSLNTFVPN